MRYRPILLVSAALLTACGSEKVADTTQPQLAAVDESKPMLVPDGPLAGVLMTAARPDARSRRIESRAKFSPSDTGAYAVVRVAPVAQPDSKMSVAWFRLTAQGRRHLFTHEVAMKAGGGRVVSGAVARGGLTPGLYEIVARLGGRQVRTPWLVTSESLESASSEPEPGNVEWEADWGDDWDSDPRPPIGACSVVEINPFVFMLFLETTLEWQGNDCSTVSLAAAVRGTPQVYASVTDPEPSRAAYLKMDEELCSIPGASDFPGAVVRFLGRANEREQRLDYTLVKNPENFAVDLESAPEPGSRVAAGDIIDLRAAATDFPPSFGLKLLSLHDDNHVIASTRSLSGATEPRPCDQQRFVAFLGDWPTVAGSNRGFPPVHYRVPDSAPPVIKICAQAETFDGITGTFCGEYYTGEVWDGTLEIVASTVGAPPGPCGDPVRLKGKVRMNVAADGGVRGTIDVTGPCVSNPHGEFTGTATAAAFLFPEMILYTNGEPISKVSSTQARATRTNFQGFGGVGARWVTTWSLKCTSCPAPSR